MHLLNENHEVTKYGKEIRMQMSKVRHYSEQILKMAV